MPPARGGKLRSAYASPSYTSALGGRASSDGADSAAAARPAPDAVSAPNTAPYARSPRDDSSDLTPAHTQLPEGHDRRQPGIHFRGRAIRRPATDSNIRLEVGVRLPTKSPRPG
jgi:hypothetical protein